VQQKINGGVNMQYHQVEVDSEVFRFVKEHAEPLVDTFNSTLRRLLPLSNLRTKVTQVSRTEDMKLKSNSELPTLTRQTPSALGQILEVIHLVRRGAYTRQMATNRVAKLRNITPQAVLDKYCRQLNLRADDFDRLLAQENMGELRKILKTKFQGYSEVIDRIIA
jgi:negative regulator of replication initiation